MLGRRQHLEGHLGHGDQGAEAAGEQLAQVIAGDVLHDPAAGLDRVAAPGHRAHAEEVIARCAGLDPTRAREVAGDHAADRAAPWFAAKQRAVIRRLERELLLVVGEAGLDLGQRRPDLRRHHELGRLIQANAAEAIETDLDLCLDRTAVATLGARAEDLERRLVRCGRSHDLPQLLGGARPDLVRHTPRPAPAGHPRAAGSARDASTDRRVRANLPRRDGARISAAPAARAQGAPRIGPRFEQVDPLIGAPQLRAQPSDLAGIIAAERRAARVRAAASRCAAARSSPSKALVAAALASCLRSCCSCPSGSSAFSCASELAASASKPACAGCTPACWPAAATAAVSAAASCAVSRASASRACARRRSSCGACLEACSPAPAGVEVAPSGARADNGWSRLAVSARVPARPSSSTAAADCRAAAPARSTCALRGRPSAQPGRRRVLVRRGGPQRLDHQLEARDLASLLDRRKAADDGAAACER